MSFHDPYRPKSAQKMDAEPVAKQESSEPEVPSGTTKEMLAWVDGDKTRAQQALDAENKSDEPRKGLVRELNEILSSDK